MSAPAWLRCPEPHAGQDPDAIRRLSGHGFDPAASWLISQARVIAGSIAWGWPLYGVGARLTVLIFVHW